MLLNDRSQFYLARQLRSGEATLGEVFSFISGLYFRGKLTYARAFARPQEVLENALVITAGRGLMPASDIVTLADLRAFASVAVDPRNPAFSQPLAQGAAQLRRRLGGADQVVLLGSIATGKYASILGEVLGNQLRFPLEFVGRGDMSRGGLMLRCVEEGRELTYVPVQGATLRGKRPARLLPRQG